MQNESLDQTLFKIGQIPLRKKMKTRMHSRRCYAEQQTPLPPLEGDPSFPLILSNAEFLVCCAPFSFVCS